jgi:general secretion pathway protein G
MNVPIRKRKGFTLIELLIVITIIGILAVALVPRISQGPARARDVQRKADMQNIASALELFYADTGSYPYTATFDACDYLDDELSSYLGDTFPTAPAGAATGECTGGTTDTGYYYSTTDGSDYLIGVAMETEADSYYCEVNPIGDTIGDLCTLAAGAPSYYAIQR